MLGVLDRIRGQRESQSNAGEEGRRVLGTLRGVAVGLANPGGAFGGFCFIYDCGVGNLESVSGSKSRDAAALKCCDTWDRAWF